jgi:hypothetical protein
MIIDTVIGLRTNGLLAVYVYCHYCVRLLSLLCTFTSIIVYVYCHYCGRSPAEIVGSNPTGGMILSVVSVVCCQVEVSATS